jgi:hypothetical protein
VGISRSHYPRVPLVVPTLVMPFIESQVHFQKGLTNPVSLAIPGAWSPGTRSGRFYDKSNFPFFSCSFSISTHQRTSVPLTHQRTSVPLVFIIKICKTRQNWLFLCPDAGISSCWYTDIRTCVYGVFRANQGDFRALRRISLP